MTGTAGTRRMALGAILLGTTAWPSFTSAQQFAQDALDAGSPVDAASLVPATSVEPSADASTRAADEPEVSAPPASLPPPAEIAIDVTVSGPSKAQRTRESAQAVTVVELRRAKQQSADLGEVLARVQGIHVRRQGGLGSNTRFSLNGLTDDQVRFMLDDVPLELAGFSQGIANVPLTMLDRVVVYRGVVPVRFGADALGGLVNLISTQPTRGAGAGASYQVGSFGTHRTYGYAYQVHKPTGLFTRLNVYADRSLNDYDVTVPVGDNAVPARVRRFHDRYRAFGGALEVGVVKRPWAERLVLRGFGMWLDQQLQHSPVDMTVPYGEAMYDRANYGATLRYEQPLGERVRLEALVGYSYQPTNFDDRSAFIYDWYGHRVRLDPTPGETTSRAIDQITIDHASFARAVLSYEITEGHKLELAPTPALTERTGKDHLITTGRDPLEDEQRLLTVVTGLAYELNVLDDLLENTLFAKSYVYRTRAQQTAPNGTVVERDRSLNRFGVGDGLRVRITRSLFTKASYELTTRLPRAIEVFGDGVFLRSNLELKPERSHNGNLELTLEHPTAHAGRVRASANGFLRKIDHHITKLVGTRRNDTRYDNVFAATSRGVEANAGWSSPGDYIELDANVTYVSLRNDSTRGTYGMYEGDRIPNRPYLFGNGTTRGMLHALFAADDELSLTWYARYVHAFYRAWESLGSADSKAEVPSQWSHSLVLGYRVKLDKLELTSALEGQNITDAMLFDDFGIQRPGRGYYFKLTAQR